MIILSSSSGVVGASCPSPILDGLQLWMSADVGVTTNASNQITGWRDRSKNNLLFVPDAASAQFTYASSVASLGNRPAIYCSTSSTANNGLYNSSTATHKSVCIVYILESVASYEYSIIFEVNGINLYTSYGFGNRKFGSYLNNFYDATTLSTVNTAYYRTTTSEAGTSTSFFTNGAANGTPTGNGFYLTRTQSVIGNGGARLAGPAPSINQPFQGWIAEIIGYNRVISTQERLRIEGYLGRKYGLTYS